MSHPREFSEFPISSVSPLWSRRRATVLNRFAGNEAVVHLDDLLLRRVRIGLTAPKGGLKEIAELRRVLQPALSWDDVRWKEESTAYHRLWRLAHAPLRA